MFFYNSKGEGVKIKNKKKLVLVASQLRGVMEVRIQTSEAGRCQTPKKLTMISIMEPHQVKRPKYPAQRSLSTHLYTHVLILSEIVQSINGGGVAQAQAGTQFIA